MMNEEKKRLLAKKIGSLSECSKREPNMEHAVEQPKTECSKQGQKTGLIWNGLERSVEHEKCQIGMAFNLKSWHPTPRYVVAELVRFGIQTDEAMRIAWAAWHNATATCEERMEK